MRNPCDRRPTTTTSPPPEDSTVTTMTEPTTRTLAVPGATLTYDVRSADAGASPAPVLFIIGSPMGASGFRTLASHFTDRTVITYDPRGMEGSTREPDSELAVEVYVEDYYRVIEAVGQIDAILAEDAVHSA